MIESIGKVGGSGYPDNRISGGNEISPAARSGGASRPEKEFAAYFVTQLMKEALPEGGLLGEVGGYEYQAYQDIFTEELSAMIEEQMGFSQMVRESVENFKARSKEVK